jgi:dTDP-4-amino-4,6-dideoxygalactose transaminase
MYKYKIPYVNYDRYNYPIKNSLLKSFKKTLDSGRYILGPQVKKFEEEFCSYLNLKYALGVSNGTCALRMSLKELGVKAGDEVILAPNAFVANVSSIIDNQATPVFVDVDEDFNIDPKLIEKKITKRTKVIMVVHLYGRPAKIEEIIKIARKYNLKILEDCSQAFGSKLNNKFVGSFGDMAVFSLHPLKNLNAYGDAGVISTKSKKTYKNLAILRNHGLINRDTCIKWGCNCRLDEMQAGLLRVTLKYFNKTNKSKRQTAKYFNRYLKNYLIVPQEICEKKEHHVYQTYVIRTKYRDELKKYLKKMRIETLIYYPIPLHMQPASKSFNYKSEDFKNALKFSKEMLSLPIYPFMRHHEKKYVVNNIIKFFKNI